MSEEAESKTWKPGDIVTRDGNDEYKIVENIEGLHLTVKCLVPPCNYETDLKAGDLDHACAYRFSFLRSKFPAAQIALGEVKCVKAEVGDILPGGITVEAKFRL